MNRSLRSSSILQGAVLICALMSSSCSSSHGPQTADTNTSWLRACVDDIECRGFGSCIERVCSLACSDATAANVCSNIGVMAICDMPAASDRGRCDLLCNSSGGCAALGSNHSCQDGRCRLGAAPSTDDDPRATPTDIPQTREFVTDEPDLEDLGLSLAEDSGALMTRSEWLDDHWRVMYRTARLHKGNQDINASWTSSPAEYGLTTLNVYPNGSTTTAHSNVQVTPLVSSLEEVSIGSDGTVAEVIAPWRGGTIRGFDTGEVRFHLPGEQGYRSLPFPATAMIMKVVPVPRSGDWLVLVLRDETTQLAVALGRYNPAEGRWITEPQVVFDGFELIKHSAWLGTHGEDAQLAWARDGVGLLYTRLSGVAATDPASTPRAASWRTLAPPDAHSSHRDHPDRRIVISAIRHGDQPIGAKRRGCVGSVVGSLLLSA